MSLNPISSQSLTVFIYLFNPSDPPGPVGVEEALSGGRSEFILPRSTVCTASKHRARVREVRAARGGRGEEPH